MTNLFVYGTLLNDEVLTLLLGCNPNKSSAVLPSYQCVLVSGENYPAIYPKQNSSVSGHLLEKLSPEQMEILDDYEGSEYERITVTATLEDNTAQQCDVYVYKPEFYAQLSDAHWSNDIFREEHLTSFLQTLE